MTMKNRGKIEKIRKKYEKIRLLILLGNDWPGSDLAMDLDGLCYFQGWHAKRGYTRFSRKFEFTSKGKWFYPENLYMKRLLHYA